MRGGRIAQVSSRPAEDPAGNMIRIQELKS
jgi:hypothetical protein